MENPLDLDVRRIQALKDATFAVALTIMVLEITVPGKLSHTGFLNFLKSETSHSVYIYFLSFVIIGAYWIDSHFHHSMLLKTNKVNSWLNILFLMFICLIPFSSSLLINYRNEELSNVFYGINLLMASTAHLVMFIYTWKKGFVQPYITEEIYRNIRLRILIPIIIYCILIGVTFIVPSWSRFLFLVPLSFQIFFGRSRRE